MEDLLIVRARATYYSVPWNSVFPPSRAYPRKRGASGQELYTHITPRFFETFLVHLIYLILFRLTEDAVKEYEDDGPPGLQHDGGGGGDGKANNADIHTL